MPDPAVRYANARQRVLDAMIDGAWVSWRTMRQVGGVRYSARLLELRRLGYSIETRGAGLGDGKEYRLVSPIPGLPQRKQVKVFLSEDAAQALLAGRLLPSAEIALKAALASFDHNREKL